MRYFNYIAKTDMLISDTLRGGAFFHLGELFLMKKNYNKARECFKECLLRIPQHVKANNYICEKKQL